MQAIRLTTNRNNAIIKRPPSTTLKDDKRLVLQATDFLKNSIFSGSSAQQIENGPAESELGLSISNGKAKASCIEIHTALFT